MLKMFKRFKNTMRTIVRLEFGNCFEKILLTYFKIMF